MNQYVEQITLGDIVVAKKNILLMSRQNAADEDMLYRQLCAEATMKLGGSRRIGFF